MENNLKMKDYEIVRKIEKYLGQNLCAPNKFIMFLRYRTNNYINYEQYFTGGKH